MRNLKSFGLQAGLKARFAFLTPLVSRDISIYGFVFCKTLKTGLLNPPHHANVGSKMEAEMKKWEYLNIFWHWYLRQTGYISISPKHQLDMTWFKYEYPGGWEEEDYTGYGSDYPTYQVIKLNPKHPKYQGIINNVITHLGKEGWESVNFQGTFNVGSAWFKRPIED